MKLWRRFRHWVQTSRADDLGEEIEAHRAMLQADLESRGMPPADAAPASRRAMGNATLAREDARQVWVIGTADRLWRDARHGLRGLRREPSFAAAAILTLALGVAIVTASFSVADAELWKPLPYPEAERLVAVYSTGPGPRAAAEYISGPDFLEWTGSRAFVSLAGIGETRRRVLRRETAEPILTASVTWNYFATLAREALIGRTFTPEDAREGGVILSEGAWRRLFDANPAIIGRTFTIDDAPAHVVGVVPADTEIQSRRDIILPIDFSSPGFLDPAERAVHGIVGRLRPGVDPGAAEAELQTVVARIAREHPDQHRRGHLVRVRALQAFYTGNWRPLYFLLGASALVLILTCVNVAGLLLVRALRRGREFAIRGALGGGTGALVRQLAIEGALLAIPAGACALLLTRWALDLVATRVPPEYLLRASAIPVDARVLAFALGLTGLTAAICAVVPALMVRRVDLHVTLAAGGRTAGSTPGRSKLRQVLLTSQVALTLVLLAGAGLFLKSYAALIQVPLGFEPDGRAALRVALSGPRYATDAQIQGYANRLLERALGVAGVDAAAVATSSPLASGPVVQFAVETDPAPAAGAEPRAILRAATPEFFDLLAIPVIEGRAFTGDDASGAPRVAVINEVLARRLFPGESPIGRTLTLLPGARAPWTRRPGDLAIVGVVGNVKEIGIDEVEFNDIYVPLAQAAAAGLELIVRAAIDPAAILRPLRDAAAGVDPQVPVGAVTPLERRVDDALQEDRFHLLLIGSFAVVAIALAGIGVYGAVAAAAHQRRREVGVRIALGARPAHVLTAALREPVRIALTGGVAGLGASLLLAALIGDALYLVPGSHNGLLFSVTTTDPVVLGGALTGVLALAVLAAAIPARRVARVDPLSVLRDE